MSFVQLLVILSIALSASGYVVYIRDTLQGKTKPNRVSWFLWAATPAIASIAALTAGADIWATLLVLSAAILPFSVLIASFFNEQSYWKLKSFDWACGAISILAIIIWQVLDSPQAAIIFAIVADMFAAAPTVRKTWIEPTSETGFAYLAEAVSVLLIVPSIPIWNIENAAFQSYILAINLVILLLIYRHRFTSLTKVGRAS